MTLELKLRAGCEALELAATDEQIAKLLRYLELLSKWNRVYNLTAIREPAEMLTHHLLDSLAVVRPLLSMCRLGGRILDVGSGGGLPGVVLAIMLPETSVTCVDAVAKKAAFVQQVALELQLPKLRGVHARVETLTDQYDVIVSRAFASLTDFVTWSGNSLDASGCWMAMKGKHPGDELSTLPPSIEVFHVEQLVVPGLDAERCIVWMRRRMDELSAP